MHSSILSLWGLWDTVYHCCRRLEYVDKGKNIFRYVLLHHNGEPLITRNRFQINQGDTIIKIHIHNYMLAKVCANIKNDIRMAMILRQQVADSLPQLAELIAKHPRRFEIKGIVGTTMLYKGAESLGFTSCNVPDTTFFRFKRWYLILMKQIIHPDGRTSKQRMAHGNLRRVFMASEEILERYIELQEV